MNTKLLLPVKDIIVNQPFGVNYVDFYKGLGLDGHNGIDFKAKIGCPVYATHNGIVSWAGKDGDGGIGVSIVSTMSGNGYKTINYHLSKALVNKGELVEAGQEIGLAGNTGKYTTGAHLHFGLKEIHNGDTINYDNGYKGAIDPSQYFKKDWDKSNAYHRYDRPREYWAEFKMRFKNPWLHKQLNNRGCIYKIYDNEFINALVYGGWDFNSVINPAMYDIWGWSKKNEYENGKRNFQ